jgi:hypothetical protein
LKLIGLSDADKGEKVDRFIEKNAKGHISFAWIGQNCVRNNRCGVSYARKLRLVSSFSIIATRSRRGNCAASAAIVSALSVMSGYLQPSILTADGFYGQAKDGSTSRDPQRFQIRSFDRALIRNAPVQLILTGPEWLCTTRVGTWPANGWSFCPRRV